jgi:hypothetical protein
MRFLTEMGNPLPKAFKDAAEFILNTDLRRALMADDLDTGRIENLVANGRIWNSELDAEGHGYLLQHTLTRMMREVFDDPDDETRLEQLTMAVDLSRRLPFPVDLGQVQTLYYRMVLTARDERKERADGGDERAREWAAQVRCARRPVEGTPGATVRPFVPLATYRIQLTREFTFSQCAALVAVPGVPGHIHRVLQPVLQAVPGSTHGYDTVDPTRLSDDLGGMSGWTALAHAAREHWMNLLLDIVPNHMAASTVNPWWRDVLEHGRLSPFAGVFDINWEPGEARLRNRVLLPVLAESLGEAIANGRLSVDLSAFGLVLTYGELQLPLDVRSYRHVLSPVAATHAGSLPPEFVRLTRAAAALHSVRELPVSRPDLLYEVRLSIKRQLLGLLGRGRPRSLTERMPLSVHWCATPRPR